MKTLKEYSEFLFKNNYEEDECPYTFLDGHLEMVDFIKKGSNFYIRLKVIETTEFSDYLQSLEIGTTYEVNYENYIVVGAFIEAPICNVSDFITGKTNGIQLVDKPCDYNYHTLDLFEFCIGFQKINLVEHELFIMSRRLEQLKWANEVLIPILEKYDYQVSYDVFFNTNQEDRNNSNPRIDLTHTNGEQLVLEIDCLTGKSIIWHTTLTKVIDLSDLIYEKNSAEVFNILLEEIWKKDGNKYGYIYNNDPHETVDTYHEVGELFMCLEYKEKTKRGINFDVIPSRYSDLVEQYKKLQ